MTHLAWFPGVFPTRVLSRGSSWAGCWGLRPSRGRSLPWWWAAPLQAGVHRAGAGGSGSTGLLANQQIPLPLHQREHAAPCSLQHGEAAQWLNRHGELAYDSHVDFGFSSLTQLTVKALQVCPESGLGGPECCLRISLLPLRLNIDQVTKPSNLCCCLLSELTRL